MLHSLQADPCPLPMSVAATSYQHHTYSVFIPTYFLPNPYLPASDLLPTHSLRTLYNTATLHIRIHALPAQVIPTSHLFPLCLSNLRPTCCLTISYLPPTYPQRGSASIAHALLTHVLPMSYDSKSTCYPHAACFLPVFLRPTYLHTVPNNFLPSPTQILLILYFPGVYLLFTYIHPNCSAGTFNKCLTNPFPA